MARSKSFSSVASDIWNKLPRHLSSIFHPWICLPPLIRHKILLSRLSSFYGLSNTALNLIASYLLNRTQSVSIQSHSTPPSSIFTGIPQGSVLGPFLFRCTQALSVKSLQRLQFHIIYMLGTETEIQLPLKRSSRFQRLFPNPSWLVWGRASRHQKLAPTFPGIDSCLMVTKQDFLEMEASLWLNGRSQNVAKGWLST